MQECTFHPELCIDSLALPTNPVRMAVRRRVKLARANAAAAREYTHHPKLINPLIRFNPSPIHERLYSLAAPQPVFDSPRSQASFKPPNSTHLFSEASERLARQAHRLATHLQTTKEASRPRINPRSSALLTFSVTKEAAELLGNPAAVSFDIFTRVMYQMGYSPSLAPPSPGVLAAWRCLGPAPSPSDFIKFISDLHSNVSLAQKFRDLLDCRRNRKIRLIEVPGKKNSSLISKGSLRILRQNSARENDGFRTPDSEP